LRADLEAIRPLAAADCGAPFAVAAVEDENGAAGAVPQLVAELVGLPAFQRDLSARGQRCIDEQAGTAEIGERHGRKSNDRSVLAYRRRNARLSQPCAVLLPYSTGC
jgi:hypothetical protein